MKKMIAVLLCLCFVCVFLAACTNEVKQPEESAQPDETVQPEESAQPDGVAQPDGYPDGVISWIVPSSAGGATDTFTRAIGNANLGGNVVVENIKGGGQSIGMSECFARPADGKTLMTISTTGLITMPLTSEVIYSQDDFRYITKLANDSLGVVVVRPDSPLETADDIWALMTGDKEYHVGVSSIGGHSHVEMSHALLQLDKFDNAVNVVYSGSNGVMQAVMNGEVDFGLMDDNYIVPYVENGDMRALMTLYSDRSVLLPDVKCLGEYGITGLEPLVGVKIVALRKDTPDDVVEWIKQQVNMTVMGDEYQQFLEASGAGKMDRVPTEDELTQWVSDATKCWDEVLTASGLK